MYAPEGSADVCGGPALDLAPIRSLSSVVFVSPGAGGGSVPNLPIFFNHTSIGGSFPPTHPTSISSSPRSRFPLAHTAAKASPICLNGTRAVPYFGGLSRFFLGDLSDRTIESVSVRPKDDISFAIDSAVVRLGCVLRVYLMRMVVSRGSMGHC